MLIAMAGLSGTGKSTLARALAPRLNAFVLDKDIIRAALFANEVDYTSEQNNLCGQIMFQVAGYLFKKDAGQVVILDGRTFSKRYQVDDLLNFAIEVDTPLYLIECVAADAIARERIERDALAGTHLAADRDFAMYQRMQAQFEPITAPKLVLDTGTTDIDTCLRRVLEYVDG